MRNKTTPPPSAAAAASALPNDVWSDAVAPNVTYYVRPPWVWVMEGLQKPGMTRVPTPAELPSRTSFAMVASPQQHQRGGRRNAANKELKGPGCLKVEIVEDGRLVLAVHGTSVALDGLEDKDELVRTLQRCRAEHLGISPPSKLISWDVTYEECLNVVGKEMPVLDGSSSSSGQTQFAVLKEPMGSQGQGIYFVSSADQIHKTISVHRQKATETPEFLNAVIEAKGRIPSWVLQAEVPSMLINQRKFHIRSYVVARENHQSPDLVEIFIYNRHEVCVAGVPIVASSGQQEQEQRDPQAHITNGALSEGTERRLLHETPELAKYQGPVERFIATAFLQFLPDVSGRVSYGRRSAPPDDRNIQKFATAGLDLMITAESGKLYLLEVNSNPAAPRDDGTKSFKDHLMGFQKDLIDLVVTGAAGVPNFLPLHSVLGTG